MQHAVWPRRTDGEAERSPRSRAARQGGLSRAPRSWPKRGKRGKLRGGWTRQGRAGAVSGVRETPSGVDNTPPNRRLSPCEWARRARNSSSVLCWHPTEKPPAKSLETWGSCWCELIMSTWPELVPGMERPPCWSHVAIRTTSWMPQHRVLGPSVASIGHARSGLRQLP